MLAIVVVVTSLPRDYTLSQPLLEQFCFQVVQHLAVSPDEDETASLEIAMTSLNCIKTLIAAATRQLNATLCFCIGQLLPAVVQYLIESSKKVVKGDGGAGKGGVILHGVMETMPSLCSMAHDELHCARLIGIVLPVLSLFLLESQSQDNTLSTLVVHEILAIAHKHPAAFRQVVSLLDIRDRQLVESSIRAAVGSTSLQDKQASAPSRVEARKIELKSFG